MKVTLISHTPDCAKLIASAARLCYSSKDIDHLLEGMTNPDSQIDMLLGMGHESPFEHCSFTFGIEGVSRALLAQLTRHRLASYSVKSQRYVDESLWECVVPPAIAANPKALEIFNETTEYLRKQYIELCEILAADHIAAGSGEKPASKMAIEDARFVLPNSCATQLIMTMNVRSLFNFFKLRCCERAQWEIRELANRILCIVQQIEPSVFAKAGAPCVSGSCTEGKMSCGKSKRI